jgi:demethylspheroidene O-methyltransferase
MGAIDRLSSWFRVRRDRCVASPHFRRIASSFPLTRPIARRRARAVFDLCAGFVYTQILYACVKVRVFDLLAQGPRELARLAETMQLPVDGARRLLEAAVSLRLLERRGEDRYGLGTLGAPLVRNPGLTAMIEHHAVLYADLADPLPLLRGDVPETALSRYWSYAHEPDASGLAPADVDAFTTLMSASQSLIAEEVLASYRFDRHRCLLDVAGGDGTFVATVAARYPNLQVMLFDLPAVAQRASMRFAQAGLDQRAKAYGGDFLRDALPEGADLISIVRVLHDHDDAAAFALLRAAFHALPAGGTLLIVEPMADTPGAEPMGAAYFGFYLLAMGQGRPRSAHLLTQMLRSVGFKEVERVATPTPLQTSVLVARHT